MYACGVYRSGVAANHMGGVYLWAGNQDGGWGSDGEGAITGKEYYGTKRGRWFCNLPFGVVAVDAPTAQASYAGRLYLGGGYSHNLVLDEHHRLWKQGIRPPEELPDFAAGGGSGTLTAYFSWYDEMTGERSPLSLGQLVSIPLGSARTWQNLPERPPDDIYLSDDLVTLDGFEGGFNSGIHWIGGDKAVTAGFGSPGGRIAMMRPGDELDLLEGATQRFSQAFFQNPLCFDTHNDWIGIGTTPSVVDIIPVTRATHLELWLQPAADFPRLALRVARGTASVVEATALGDLGEAFISSFQRMPRASVNAIYHDRQIVSGDPENPDTIYLSQLFFPERWDGLKFQTKSGEPITGILATRDYCLVFTRNATYMLQGYTDSDYTFQLIDQSLGSVGHNCNIVIHGNPYVLTEKGPFMYNGMFHPLSPENRWNPVSTGASSSPFRGAAESMEATDDPYYNTYIVSNAWDASKSIGHPYDETDLNVDSAGQFFAVLDYTLVQPETGGALRPARLSYDRSMALNPPIGVTNSEQIKYLRTRWGEGNLYHVGYDPFGSGIGTFAYPGGETAPTTISFSIIAMRNVAPAHAHPWPPNLYLKPQSRIILPFYYFEDTGGYSFAAKKFPKVWIHGSFPRQYQGAQSGAALQLTNNWTVKVYAGPDSGFWNLIKDGLQWLDGNGDEWQYASPCHEISPGLNNFGGYAIDNEDHIQGDILESTLPTNLQGRGLWLDIQGDGDWMWFEGFGGYHIPGATVQPFVVFTPE